MSSREPFELLEISVPRCANRYGVGPCVAGLGNLYAGAADTDFLAGGLGSWTDTNGTLALEEGGARFTASAANSRIEIALSGDDRIDGDAYSYVTVAGVWLGGTPDEWSLYFVNATNPVASNLRRGFPVNFSRPLRGVPGLNQLQPGDEFVAVWHLEDAAGYSTDWQGQLLAGLRIDFGSLDDVDVRLHSVRIGTASLFDGRGQECYNTRVTCQNVSNFQARPLNQLTPDQILNAGTNGTYSGSATRMIFSAEVTFDVEPFGVIWSAGGDSSGPMVFVGFNADNDLVVRCGTSTSIAADTARLVADMTQFLGGTYTLICTFFSDGTNTTVQAFLFCPANFILKDLGSVTAPDSSPAIMNSGTIYYGDGAITVPVGEYVIVPGLDLTYNGIRKTGRFYEDQFASFYPESDRYRQRFYFDDGRQARPADDLHIRPMLSGATTVGAKINQAGTDRKYEPLGRRAVIEATLLEVPDSDSPEDYYLGDRQFNPLTRSQFWAKWMQREKFGRTRALIRRYTGQRGDRLAGCRQQTYVHEDIRWQDGGGVRIFGRDFLTLTEFKKAQVPAPTSGRLLRDITAGATSLTLVGDVTDEYPRGSNTLFVGDELLTYTARSVVNGDTVFTGLTRGTDGTTAEAHSADDSAQLAKRYTDAALDDILTDLIITEAGVPGQYVDRAQIADKVANEFLGDYVLSTVIPEPTGVSELLGELCLSCAFDIWNDERDQKITIRPIEAVEAVDRVLTYESDIVQGSLTLWEEPDRRVSTFSLLYRPRNFADDLDKASNFEQQLVFANSTSVDPDAYEPQLFEVFSRWIRNQVQAIQTTSRVGVVFEDVPRYARFLVDDKDADLWVGNVIGLSHPDIVTREGTRDEDGRWLVLEAEEVEAGHLQRLTVADISLAGTPYFITSDAITGYTSELFAEGNAFLTDENGLNPDGTRGARLT